MVYMKGESLAHKYYRKYKEELVKVPTTAHSSESKSFAAFREKQNCTSSLDQLEKPVNVKWNVDHKKWER